MVGIVSWGSYIPKYRIAAEVIASVHGIDAAQISQNLGIIEKSVPGIDEDTATIAVEAARNALAAIDISLKEIGCIYIGSESHPYAVKPTGTILGEALSIGTNYMTADFQFACKAGTAAIQAAIGLVKSGMIKFGIAGGCDTAQAAAGDPLEYTSAAGGAVFIIGQESVVAEINHTISFSSDTPDFWRRAYQKYPNHAGSFTGEPAYYRHVINATNLLMQRAGTKPNDYDFAVFHQPNAKFPRRAAKQLDFSDKQIRQGLLVDKIGNTYAGSTLLGLAAVLDIAQPGQKILLTSYGSGAGCDSFDITVTEHITKIKPRKVQEYIDKKKYINYPAYLKNTGMFR
jgi:hydroxymethylglutaryl-CoA synthase